MPRNALKRALAERRTQVGCWLGLCDAYSAEVVAGTGFDWLLIDMEHAPNDIRTVMAQFQAIQSYPVHVLVRPVDHNPATIKQLLDIGVQSLIIPMVESADEARRLVQAMRYPPQGFRGVGTAEARAARWNRTPNYLKQANDEMCLLVQIESKKGLQHLDEIARVDGVDGIFIGPSDLAASLGHLGNSAHPEVQAAIEDALKRTLGASKAPGIFASDPEVAKRHMKDGAVFVAVGLDIALLSNAAAALAQSFKAPR